MVKREVALKARGGAPTSASSFAGAALPMTTAPAKGHLQPFSEGPASKAAVIIPLPPPVFREHTQRADPATPGAAGTGQASDLHRLMLAQRQRGGNRKAVLLEGLRPNLTTIRRTKTNNTGQAKEQQCSRGSASACSGSLPDQGLLKPSGGLSPFQQGARQDGGRVHAGTTPCTRGPISG